MSRSKTVSYVDLVLLPQRVEILRSVVQSDVVRCCSYPRRTVESPVVFSRDYSTLISMPMTVREPKPFHLSTHLLRNSRVLSPRISWNLFLRRDVDMSVRVLFFFYFLVQIIMMQDVICNHGNSLLIAVVFLYCFELFVRNASD